MKLFQQRFRRLALQKRSVAVTFSILAMLCAGALCQSQTQSYHVSLNTAALVGHAAGPFALNFQLTDGSGSTPGDANNTAKIFNFNFGGGSGGFGNADTQGGAAGNLNSAVTLADTDLLNDFAQSFMPGSTLAFDLTLTNVADVGGTPDEFTFAILDSAGIELPTLGLASVGADVFLLTDLTGEPLIVQSFGSDATQSPAAGGVPLTIAAPNVVAVPEPGSVALCMGLAITGTATFLRRRKTARNSA